MERHRPFLDISSSAICDIGHKAIQGNDLETYSFCIAELAGRRRQNAKVFLEQLRESTDMVPISWIEQVAYITHSQQWPQSGDCSIYLVLLSQPRKELGTYGIYVGETIHTPEKRFQVHKDEDGKRGSRHVKIRGIMLLPQLYSHWNCLDREDAKKWESVIADAIRASLLCEVKGGH